MLAHFQHGGHETEVLINRAYHHTVQDSVMSYFIASARDKSDGMYSNSVRQLVTHQTDH